MAFGLFDKPIGLNILPKKKKDSNPNQLSDPNANLEDLRLKNLQTRNQATRAAQANITGTPSATSPTPPPSPAREQFLSNVAAPSGFQTQLSPDDPAAIGGRAMAQQAPQIPTAPTAPPVASQATPQQPPGADSAFKDAYTQYIQSLGPGKDSTKAKEAYLDFIQQRDLGLQEIEDKPIPLRFTTGQQASLQKLSGIEGARLQGDIGLAQGAEAQTQAQNLARLNFEQAQQASQASANKPIEVGGRLINPQTGEVIYEPPAEGTKPVTLSPGQRLVDPTTGEEIFIAPPTTENEANELLSIKDAQALGVPYGTTKGQAFGLSPIDEDAQKAMQRGQSQIYGFTQLVGDPNDPEDTGTIGFVEEMFKQTTTLGGLGRQLSSKVGGTDSFDLNSNIDTLKSVLAFDRLQKMRDESPTGGALGQVSDNELRLLSSAVASLDIGQSNPTLKSNLEKVRKHYTDLLNKANQDLQSPTPTDQTDPLGIRPGGDTQPFNKDLSTSQKGSGDVLALGEITGLDGSSFWKHGLDIDLKIGDPVPTPAGGEVIFVGENGGFGNQIQIRTAQGNTIWLSHLESADVKVGDQVTKGQYIAKGGNTGKTIPGEGGDGSHLDLTIQRPDGSYFPPREIARILGHRTA